MTLGTDAEPTVCFDVMPFEVMPFDVMPFDVMPFEVGPLWGCKVRLQLYTVPGRTECNETRRLILGGVDGLVFVADAQRGREGDSARSLSNLRENLAEDGHARRCKPAPVRGSTVRPRRREVALGPASAWRDPVSQRGSCRDVPA